MSYSISVILPNYNGKHLLETFLPYTYSALEARNLDYEIIVVDDCSTDDSISFLNDSYPGIKVLRNSKNSGFSKTCNFGIQAATKQLTLLLNTDVKLSEDYFSGLSSYFEDPETFGVMGRIIGMNDELIQDAARIPKFNGFKIQPSNFFYTAQKDIKVPTLYLSGANALVDTTKLKALNGFNEIFSPFYGEDLDLGVRAWRSGWKCYYDHDAICRHQLSSTTKNLKKEQYIKMVYFRNRYIFYQLHWDGVNLFLLHVQLFLMEFLFGLITFKAYKIKAYLNFWKQYSTIKENKKILKLYLSKTKNLSFKMVVSLLSHASKKLNLDKVPKKDLA